MKLEIIANGVLDASLLYTREAGRADPDVEWLARQERKINGGIAEITRVVGWPFALGARFTLADAAVGALLSAIDFAGSAGLQTPASKWRLDWPVLRDYLDALSERASFVATRPVMFDFDFKFQNDSSPAPSGSNRGGADSLDSGMSGSSA